MTNGSAYPASVQAPRLRAVGLPVPDERLFTPNSVAGKAMVERGYERVLVLGTQGVGRGARRDGRGCVLP
jgi:4-nitrophenyl phosphatase